MKTTDPKLIDAKGNCVLCSGDGLSAGDCPGCGKRKLIPGLKAITEELRLQDGWMQTAKEMTLEKLPAFLRMLTEEYQHDYGTIVHAIAAAAVAAATAVNKSPTGGITGFQASFVMWEFIKQWGHMDGPMRLVQYRNLLFPQHADQFQHRISAETWEWVRKEAAKQIAEHLAGPKSHVHPDVLAHWESITNGTVPFGLTVADEWEPV